MKLMIYREREPPIMLAKNLMRGERLETEMLIVNGTFRVIAEHDYQDEEIPKPDKIAEIEEETRRELVEEIVKALAEIIPHEYLEAAMKIVENSDDYKEYDEE